MSIFFHIGFANEKREEVLKLIDEELTEVVRLNKATRSSNPDFMLRLVELILEKGRLLREMENERFLTIAAEKRTVQFQKEHFSKSEKYFAKSKELCIELLKKFPSYKKRANVHFTLGYFDKEHLNYSSAKKQFLDASKMAQGDALLKAKSHSILGEIAYLEKDFSGCIDWYNKSFIVKDTENRWLTKDLYNLSWCYYREKKIDIAITKMESVLKLSKSSDYVDLTSQANRDIGLFLAQAGRTTEAIAYYQNSGSDVLENLSKIVDAMIAQSKLAVAEDVAQALIKQANKDALYRKKGLFHLLNIYSKSDNIEKHLNIAMLLVSEKDSLVFDVADKEELKFQIDRYSSLLQKSVLSINIKAKDKIRNKRTRISVEYFKLRAILNPSIDYKSNLAAAETLYANKSYNTAADYYVLAMNKAKEVGDKELYQLSFNGLASCLSQKSIRKEIKDKYLIEVFKAQITSAPKSEKTNLAYQRLFTEYLNRDHLEEADKLIIEYSKSFPSESTTTEAMIGKVIDLYRAKGNLVAVESWQKTVGDKNLKVSSKFTEKFNKIILGTQFEKAEKALESGDKRSALIEYTKIFKDSKSSQESRANSAYNIAIIYYEYGDLEQIRFWTLQALRYISEEQLKKQHPEISKLALLLFNRRKLESSSTIYAQLFKRLCRTQNNTIEGYLRNSFTILLALNQYKDANDLFNIAKNCTVKNDLIISLKNDLLRYYFEEQMIDSAESFISSEKVLLKKDAMSLYTFGKIYEAYVNTDVTKAESTRKIFLKTWSIKEIKNMNIGRETSDLIVEFYLEDLRTDLKNIKAFKLEFPQEKFNKLLTKYIKEIEALANSMQLILELKSGHGATAAYSAMIEAYSAAADKIESFTPEGKAADYIESFHKSMKSVTSVLLAQRNEMKSVAQKIVLDQSLITKNAKELIGNSDLFLPTYIHYMRRGVK